MPTWIALTLFKLLDDIFAQARNNLVREFSNADDITSWLRDQWAGLLAHFISQKREDTSVGQIQAEIQGLASVVTALKTYSEQIVRATVKGNSEQLISQVDDALSARRLELMIKSVPEFEHLMTAHEATANGIAEALRKSETIEELSKHLEQASKDSCGAHSVEAISGDIGSINRVRSFLKLKRFPAKDDEKLRSARSEGHRTIRDRPSAGLKSAGE